VKKYTIAVVGLWHLGEIYSAGLAELGHTVIGFDNDEKVVCKKKNGKVIAGACSPCNTRRNASVPSWCPLINKGP